MRRGGVPGEVAAAPRAEEDVVGRDGGATEAPVGVGRGVAVVGRDPDVVACWNREVEEREGGRVADAAVEAGAGEDGERQGRVGLERRVVEGRDIGTETVDSPAAKVAVPEGVW